MKIKQSNKMRPSVSKRILIFGCLFAVINLYGQESTPSVSPEPVSTIGQAKADQAYCQHELSVWGAGGLSTLRYSPTFGDRSSKLGGAFGLGYTFYFSEQFGVLAGVELAFYNAKVTVNGLTDHFGVIDRTGNDGIPRNVDFRTKFSNYEETQRMMNINIPIALQFQQPVIGKHKFFASLGFKLGFPVSGSYKVSDNSTLKTSGYYYVWNHELLAPRYLGYGTFRTGGSKEDFDFGFSFMGTVEAGMKWRLNQLFSLYTGVYFEYGFNDIVDRHGDRFLVYNEASPANFTTNSLLTSQYTQNGQTKSFVNHVSPVAFGLKVRLGMDFLCRKGEKPVKETQPKQPEIIKETPKVVEVEQTTQFPETTGRIRPSAPPRMGEDEEFDLRTVRAIPDEEIVEDFERLVIEYGSSVKGAITIELDGYELNQSALSPAMERILDEKVEQIRRTYGTNISIVTEGHTCDLGNKATNMKLGQKRADVVRNFLISRGFAPNKVEAVSKGQTSPIVPNDSDANRKKNRRVVFIIKG